MIRGEVFVDRDPSSQIDVLLSAVVRVAPQMSHVKPEAGMPLDEARNLTGGGFHCCSATAGIQDQRLHVPVESDGSVDLRLDVAVQTVETVSLGQLDERKGRGDSEGRGFGGAVRVAERGSREGLGCEPEVRGAEPRCPAGRLGPEVQCAVDGAFSSGGMVVGTPKIRLSQRHRSPPAWAVRPPLLVPVTNCDR